VIVLSIVKILAALFAALFKEMQTKGEVAIFVVPSPRKVEKPLSSC
jgi:hypothetical protein